MNTEPHERARKLIALGSPEALSAADQSWLRAHLETCVSCGSFAENVAATIRGLRAIPIAAERGLVATTQMRVRRRALELQRERERVWVVAVSCVAVTLCALLSAVVLWRSFAWLGARAEVATPVWQVGFLVVYVMPALIAGILLLARGTHLADHTGSYQG